MRPRAPGTRARFSRLALVVLIAFSFDRPAIAKPQTATLVAGRVLDDAGGPLPGTRVELRALTDGRSEVAVAGPAGDYVFTSVIAGSYELSFSLLNFAAATRRIQVGTAAHRVDAVLALSFRADVTVAARRSFRNLADVDNPAENLVGVAESASQGAITARQLDVRPIMRQGEVLETIPGVVITQHSGEGKANQYFLRGFNLDHGSDFAITVAGTPVNMTTHAHSQGYADLNFLIPEIVAGVQFSKGPYYADQGDFATAGASAIAYATSIDRPIFQVERGQYGFGRALVAASPAVRGGHLLIAGELSNNSGPWTVPDAYRKVNGVLRYSRGDAVNGLAVTFMGYHGSWHATEASPARAVDAGLIGRFGTIDPTDGGDTSRYSISAEWQRGTSTTLTKASLFGVRYSLDLISNFTFFLDDPVNGDQQEQVDRRSVIGGRLSHRRLASWFGRPAENTFGGQVRIDDVDDVGLYHTSARNRLETRASSSALVATTGWYAQTEMSWTPWLRTIAGVRGDLLRARVTALDPANSGTSSAALASPKGTATFGPWKRTELYVNAGAGFHSNNAIGTTLTRDADGQPAGRVTPLVRAIGAEVGVRTVAFRRLQSTVSLWSLRLASELVYNGDAGATEPGPASRRYGLEITNYYRPASWLVFDGDVSLSHARFASGETAGAYVPEAVGVVVSAGVGVDRFHRISAGLRLRHFGPRALIEDNSVRSKPTTLVNLQGGMQLTRRVRVTAALFNLFDSKASDIDYFFRSRLRGEPLEGVEDVHFHPTVPRTLRVATVIGF